MSKIDITFIDLETGGFNEDTHEILELGAIKTRVQDGKIFIEETISRSIIPTKPVDPVVSAINGYSEKEWNNRSLTDFHDAIADVFRMLRGSWHAGSNPAFDAKFLRKAADKLGWEYPKMSSYHLLDVSTQAFPLLIQGKVEKLKQHDLSQYYKLGPCEHRAYADALQCLKVFACLNNLEINDLAVNGN